MISQNSCFIRPDHHKPPISSLLALSPETLQAEIANPRIGDCLKLK